MAVIVTNYFIGGSKMEVQSITAGNENLLTTEQMAGVLGVQKSWLYRQTMQRGPGAIPRIRLKKYLRFDRAAVLRWIEQQQEVMQ